MSRGAGTGVRCPQATRSSSSRRVPPSLACLRTTPRVRCPPPPGFGVQGRGSRGAAGADAARPRCPPSSAHGRGAPRGSVPPERGARLGPPAAGGAGRAGRAGTSSGNNNDKPKMREQLKRESSPSRCAGSLRTASPAGRALPHRPGLPLPAAAGAGGRRREARPVQPPPSPPSSLLLPSPPLPSHANLLPPLSAQPGAMASCWGFRLGLFLLVLLLAGKRLQQRQRQP